MNKKAWLFNGQNALLAIIPALLGYCLPMWVALSAIVSLYVYGAYSTTTTSGIREMTRASRAIVFSIVGFSALMYRLENYSIAALMLPIAVGVSLLLGHILFRKAAD